LVSEVLVEVKRGGLTESVHRGSIVVVNSVGDVLYKVGNPHTLASMRSCAKPLQAIPVVDSGSAERFEFSEKELALFCGSVNGQDYHVEAVRGVLTKIGLDDSALLCGVHPPSHRPTAKALHQQGTKPGPVHNNCAGKHALMLALCVFYGWTTDNYLPMNHPVQKLILSQIAEMVAMTEENIQTAIDGCGVPVFFVPLKNLALAYAKLAQPFNEKKLRIAPGPSAIMQLMQAAFTYPEMIAGDQRLCTDIMRTLGNKVFAKTGAEGGYALTLFAEQYGVAFSIEDGSSRAVAPAVIEVLIQLGLLSSSQQEALKHYHNPVLLNHRKEQVGELRPVFTLKKGS
jgi:L-asparaginase II